MKSAKELLTVNEKDTVIRIENYIRDAVGKHGVSGVIMGLSGGVDSALVATLAVRALGKDKVHVYFLHDKNSEKDSLDKAHLVAGRLGLKLNVMEIGDRMREKEKDASFFKFLSKLPRFTIPLAATLYYLIVGETPYITTLRKMEYKNNKFKKWIYDNIMAGVEKMFDGPCEERRVILGGVAKEKNLLLIGAGNRSEDLTGWFTIKGIDNMPVSPIACLYKAQVRQMAQYLDVPEEIRRRKPSADVLRGANDALALGMEFEKIDIILYAIEHDLSDADIMRYGLVKSEIDKVRRIHRLSAWKREKPC